ncbi:hypothetical protein V2J09_007337 [Rumex salicifolius]
MGMEVAGSDVPHGNGEAKVEVSVPKLNEKENGKVNSGDEPIKFGSDGKDEAAKLEAENASKANFPKDAATEWPAEPQIHSFYLVRYRTFDDPNLKAKLDQADKEIGKRNQQRSQILDGLKAKRSDRAQVIGQLKSLGVENKAYGQVLDEKINLMKPLREALGSLRGPNNANREKGAVLCSSEAELNDIIRSLNYRMQHEVISLTEEKQILREIKQLEGTRDKVIANAAMRAKIQESMGQKDAIQDQVKLIGTDLDEVKKDRLAVRSKIKLLEDELKAVDSDINLLQQELASVTEKRDKAFETIHQLRKQRDEGNSGFYQSRSVLNKAKDLAAKKNIKAMEELACAEIENFMSSWNSGKAFRDDYEKRILASLDMRQLSRDGRMRNPNEKPLITVEQAKPAEAATFAKPAPKVVKEDVKPPKEQETVTQQKESKKKQPEPQAEEEEEYFVVEKPKKEKAVDPAKLKEIKKQEELGKQKAALERKKKLADKAAAKATLRAQKEAEKKQKEREKKLKKKEAASGLPSSQDDATENEADTAETEKLDDVEENTESAKTTTKESRDVTTKIRSRGPSKRRDNVPKAILKRKKSQNYWLWAAPAAVLVAVLLALLYKFAL